MIEAYSAKNKKANTPPPYSMLNPDTNSLSPSAKSKGARLVSATEEVNQMAAIGKNKIKIIILLIALYHLVVIITTQGNKIIKNILTS
jgi:hypothetical protein